MSNFKDALKDVNFALRVAECIIALAGAIIYYNEPYIYRIWGVDGWFFISLSYIVATLMGQKTDPLMEFVFTITYFIINVHTFKYTGSQTIIPTLLVILLAVDMLFVIKKVI